MLKKQKLFQQILLKRKQFLLITIALLIAVSIYCYLIKYRAKQKHLFLHSLPFRFINLELKEYIINYVNQK